MISVLINLNRNKFSGATQQCHPAWEDIRRQKAQGGYPWTHLVSILPSTSFTIILNQKNEPFDISQSWQSLYKCFSTGMSRPAFVSQAFSFVSLTPVFVIVVFQHYIARQIVFYSVVFFGAPTTKR